MSTSNSDIELVQRLSRSPHQVFSAFADAKTLERWLAPSPNVQLTLLQFDFGVGGDYHFALEDGATVIRRRPISRDRTASDDRFFLDWEPPDEHAGIESQVTILIAPDGPGATLTIRHERLTRSDAVTRHFARLTALLTWEIDGGL